MKYLTPIRTVFLLTILDQIAITISFPVLTFICFDPQSWLFPAATSYAARSYWYGSLSALPHIISIFAAPLLGIISDYFGRKKLLFIGALGAVVFSLCAILGIIYTTVYLLVIGYILNGCCVRTQPIALAVIADCSNNGKVKKFSSMGYLQFWIAAGAFIGPLLGGYFAKRFFFEHLNYSLPYIIGMLVGFATLYCTIKYFSETFFPQHSHQNSRPTYSKIKELLNHKTIRLLALLILVQFAWRSYYVFMPALLKTTFHYSPVLVGNFIAIIALWLALASSIGINLLSKFSEKTILNGSLISMLCGFLILMLTFFLPLKINLILGWISAIPIAMGDVIIYSLIVTLFSDSVPQDKQGSIMGLIFIVVSAVWSITGLLGGVIGALDNRLPLIIAPIGLLIAYKTVGASLVDVGVRLKS